MSRSSSLKATMLFALSVFFLVRDSNEFRAAHRYADEKCRTLRVRGYGIFYGLTDNAIRKKCKNFNLPHHSSDYKQENKKNPYKKQVAQINKDTKEIICIYESIASAARAVGASKGSHITEVCQGKLKSAYGFYWQYY